MMRLIILCHSRTALLNRFQTDSNPLKINCLKLSPRFGIKKIWAKDFPGSRQIHPVPLVGSKSSFCGILRSLDNPRRTFGLGFLRPLKTMLRKGKLTPQWFAALTKGMPRSDRIFFIFKILLDFDRMNLLTLG